MMAEDGRPALGYNIYYICISLSSEEIGKERIRICDDVFAGNFLLTRVK